MGELYARSFAASLHVAVLMRRSCQNRRNFWNTSARHWRQSLNQWFEKCWRHKRILCLWDPRMSLINHEDWRKPLIKLFVKRWRIKRISEFKNDNNQSDGRLTCLHVFNGVYTRYRISNTMDKHGLCTQMYETRDLR